MLSASRILSVLTNHTPKIGLFAVALGACSSAEPPSPVAGVGLAGTEGTVRGSVGVSAGASGKIAVTGGVAGTTATTTAASTATTGVAGIVAMGGSAAGKVAIGGNAAVGPAAGFGAQAGAAGMSMVASAGTSSAAAGTSSSAAGAGGSTAAPTAGCEVTPITADMRKSYQAMNDAYYTKFASANGVIVATGAKVGDEAISRYCRLLTEMFSNEKVRKEIIAEKMWFTMISQSEQLSSLPQINKQYGTSLNARARGLGALTPTICAEDSIMCMKGDPWNGDCICPHETGHTFYSSAIAKVPELSKRLTEITNSARSSGRLSNAYVWEDGNESGMMSWGVQAWYNCAINGTKGAYHTDINTRAEMQKELPDFYQFLSELMPVDTQYKDCYYKP